MDAPNQLCRTFCLRAAAPRGTRMPWPLDASDCSPRPDQATSFGSAIARSSISYWTKRPGNWPLSWSRAGSANHERRRLGPISGSARTRSVRFPRSTETLPTSPRSRRRPGCSCRCSGSGGRRPTCALMERRRKQHAARRRVRCGPVHAVDGSDSGVRGERAPSTTSRRGGKAAAPSAPRRSPGRNEWRGSAFSYYRGSDISA